MWLPTVASRFGPNAAREMRTDGAWADDSLNGWLDHWAQTQPTHRAVTDGTRQLDYDALRSEARSVTAWLRSVSVGRGDRVAVQLPNWSEFASIYLGVAGAGAVIVPIMMVYRAGEVAHIVRNSGATVAVTTGTFRGFDHEEMFRRLVEDDSKLRTLAVVRSPATPPAVTFEQVTGFAAETGDASYAPADDPHAVIYSSGTESVAKGCLHTWNTLAFTARALAHDVFAMTEQDTMFMPSPVTHSTGIVIGLVVPLLAGSSVHLLDVWDSTRALDDIARHRCTISATATPFVTMTLDAAEEQAQVRDLSSLRIWLCAGAPIPTALARRFQRTFTDGELLPLYGCTEVLAATVCRPGDSVERVASSDGTTVSPAVEIKLIDETGVRVPPHVVGEICYRGPGASLGYWDDPERTARTIDDDGWHHCGDLGFLDDEGYLRITGRSKDIIIRGGQNLSAREIEEHLEAHPDVRHAAVVAYADERLGERACAFIVPSPGATPTLAALRDFVVVGRGAAIQKAPERLVVVNELPMTATGKVQKYVLRDRLREHHEEGAIQA